MTRSLTQTTRRPGPAGSSTVSPELGVPCGDHPLGRWVRDASGSEGFVLASHSISMDSANRHRMAVNRRKWDEAVPLHVASPVYDVPSFKAGRSTLEPIEVERVGPVHGRSLLHLQCHFGLDTLSWARLGAKVHGVDYSPMAVRTARALALELGLPATFVEANVYDLPRRLRRKFDIVYTGKGALCWLPDLARWGEVVARFLRPGGRFFLLEDHPMSDCYDTRVPPPRLVLKHPYFQGHASRGVYDGTYATAVKMRNRVSFEWIHPVSEVLEGLIGAGLRIDSVAEYPYTYWQKFRSMRPHPDGYWHFIRGDRTIPLMWSVTASMRR